MNKIYLDADRLNSRESVETYMKECFELPDWYSGGLDSLSDCLSEVTADTEIMLTQNNLQQICGNAYAYKTLRVLGDAAENPHIRIRFAR